MFPWEVARYRMCYLHISVQIFDTCKIQHTFAFQKCSDAASIREENVEVYGASQIMWGALYRQEAPKWHHGKGNTFTSNGHLYAVNDPVKLAQLLFQ